MLYYVKHGRLLVPAPIITQRARVPVKGSVGKADVWPLRRHFLNPFQVILGRTLIDDENAVA